MAATRDGNAPTLLDLPGEIRNHIYRYVVVEDGIIEPYMSKRHDTDGKVHYIFKPGRPALASICKSIRTELLPLYYAENHFIINQWDTYIRCGYSSTDAICCDINHWRRFTAAYIKHVRNISIVVQMFTGSFPRGVTTIDAKMLPEGNMRLRCGIGALLIAYATYSRFATGQALPIRTVGASLRSWYGVLHGCPCCLAI